MAVFSSIAAALTAITGVVGTAVGAIGSLQQAKGMKRAEAVREKQMNLQAAREKRASIRESVIARAQATSNATAQGADQGSGLAGGLGQISSQNASNIQGISQGQELGREMFAANRQIARGQTMGSIGGAIQGLGSYIAGAFEQNNRLQKNGWG